MLTDTVAGYVEMRYFLDAYALPLLQEKNPSNFATFKDTSFIVDDTTGNPGYEYLFYMAGAESEDPDSNSLYNLDTLKLLCKLGETTPNILKETELTFNTDFVLDSQWTKLAQTLQFTSVGGVSDQTGAQMVYMLWLWMETAWDLTFAREDLGGNF